MRIGGSGCRRGLGAALRSSGKALADDASPTAAFMICFAPLQ
jgi:hypothetical protein